jgi:hypothetical protein
MKSYEYFIKTERKYIDFLNKIFEAYEGIGIVRTLNADAGEIKIISIDTYREDIYNIISDLKEYGVVLEIIKEGFWGGEL